MNTSLTDAHLPSAITQSMLDGYLAASASGPNFQMPDQVLRRVWPNGMPDNQPVATLIVHRYQSVNDALNDQTYVPDLSDPHALCRGYMAGVSADMMAWAPLMAAKPELFKVIMSGECGGLTEAARRIHAFWLKRRRNESGIGSILEQLAAMSPESPPVRRPN